MIAIALLSTVIDLDSELKQGLYLFGTLSLSFYYLVAKK